MVSAKSPTLPLSSTTPNWSNAVRPRMTKDARTARMPCRVLTTAWSTVPCACGSPWGSVVVGLPHRGCEALRGYEAS